MSKFVDQEIRKEELEVPCEPGQKTFTFRLLKNKRGQYLRLTEARDGRTNTICIPSNAMAQVAEVIRSIAR